MVPAAPERTWLGERAPLWDELAGLLDRLTRDQRRMTAEEVALTARRYQQAAADLAELRRREPASPLVPRLNDLVTRAHAAIYRPERERLRRAGRFLWTDYPRLVWDLRRLVGLAAGFQIVVAVAGYAWAAHDPATAGSFLPAALRDAAHRAHHPIPAGAMAPTSAIIWSHNIIVSFYDYAGGILLGLGTVYSLYVNSMLLGVLSGVATENGPNGEYWSLIVPHAVIELTSFTIAAAAGLSLADAIIRARPRPRREVLADAGRRSVAVVLGTMPLLVVAGTIEGFVTPSDLPVPGKLAVAPVTAVLLAAYLARGRRAARAAARG
jgi:uncharacterized membrane protein SpoIIM required for sporulation